ncbi:MAG: hypothetical protein A2600_11865 [Candidatus Lambdaproteobacteria bacterium RIFOXYD1_FULL_56_27]|uniref:SGNH hydrolase-type esterase domain-containing protein n=1 Tax=Candidatus Lambdaproteobacteria bacterium RIFOXYD2_FULL_56_26 TaxID=1817773 RepID=A0A1F6GXA5_9PROT|nr:MAG: hypothetical protein A2426_12200 [Candidatus Lambdaproteobacteria bacterium RIFOXYC1_FULL_56_13]OGH02795.1 MAG: hypothetical protein A2557_02980 [Candidatus Lambdaproteobacteria bacterium RIFOXYD2_FULL_56_26]OGH08038.1 MAG: hypothetical protein A2600_11865 [Candidatus Lambdaproteobacteria bacterium RIFOXYD1_FULL_56_27]
MKGLEWLAVLLGLFLAPPAFGQTKVLLLGDSLTAGFGVDPAQAYPVLVEAALKAKGYSVVFTNASVSGSTTASALGRLRWYLKTKPDLLYLALGANDGLRGQSVEGMKENLAATIRLAQAQGIKVLLVGMKMPPNYGAAYTKAFGQVYPELAKEYQLPLLPFVLDGVAGKPELNQADGIHPNGQGHRQVAELVTGFFISNLRP